MTTMKKNSLLVQNGSHGLNDSSGSSKEDYHCRRFNVNMMFHDWSHHVQDDDHQQGRTRKRRAKHVSSIACCDDRSNDYEDIWGKEDSPPTRCSSSDHRRRHMKIGKRDRMISVDNVCLVTLGLLLLLFVSGSTTTSTPVTQRTTVLAFSTAPTPSMNSQQSMNSCSKRATEWNQSQAKRRKQLQTPSCLMKSKSPTSCSKLYMIMKNNNNRIRNSHGSITSTGTTKEKKEFNTTSPATTTTTKDVIQGSNPANSSLNQPKSVDASVVAPLELKSNVLPNNTKTKEEATTTNELHINHKNDNNYKSYKQQQQSKNSGTTKDAVRGNNATSSSKQKMNHTNMTTITAGTENEDSKESIVDAIGRLAGGLLPSSGDDDNDDKKENKKLQPQSLSDQSSDTSNPFDWRSSMNRLSFGGNEEDEDEQKERRRRLKRHTSKERYRINPEEAKELDKNVVEFSSTDDAMMGLQVLPTTLSPTVVVATSTPKQKPSALSSTTAAAPQDSTLGEKLSKRRLIKQWTKEVLQSSSSSTEKKKKGDDRRTNNSSKAAADTLKDDVMLGGGRIHRDLREVAVSIASNIDTIDQYKVFHSEGGSTSTTSTEGDSSGPLQQIFQSLKVSARLINVASEQQTTELLSSSTTLKHKVPTTPEGFYYYYCGTGGGHGATTINGAVSHTTSHNGISMEDVDHAFATACTACRALRDLCALSPELSSIITEAILDASTASSTKTIAHSSSTGTTNVPGGVVAALASLLNYSIEKSNQAAQRHYHHENNGFMGAPQPQKQGSSSAFMNQDISSNNINTPVTTTSDEDSFAIPASTSSLMEEKARLCQLYVVQLCLAMTLSSDAAVYTLRQIPSLKHSIMKCSSYANYYEEKEETRGGSKRRRILNLFRGKSSSSPSSSSSDTMGSFSQQPQQKTMIMEQHDVIPVMDGTFDGRLRGASNQLLAALGYNVWVPKQPLVPQLTPRSKKTSSGKRRGLRILCIDGGGTRGIAAITSLQQIVRSLGGIEICDSFDIVAGTSTGAIISFLVALRRETSNMTRKRYDMLIKRIFVKSPLSTPMLVFTTASYDESHFMTVMDEILGDDSMLESRVHPHGPYVFAVSTKMSSTPTTVCLFRNYNYSGGELPDSFVIPPQQAKQELELLSDDNDEEDEESESDVTFLEDDDVYDEVYYDNDYNDEDYDEDERRRSTINHDGSKRAMKDMLHETTRINTGGSRNPGSFRIPQKVALRATTAAPTVFKPILMGGELYCDGGMLASNPTAIAIHEARTLFPDIPIDCVVSLGTGGFREVKSSPRIGWDGIITQIVNSATDAEQPHHILEDILGQGTSDSNSGTKYFRFNPMIGLPDDFPLDNTDPKSLEDLSRITQRYMEEPIQQQKLLELSNIMIGSGSNDGGEEDEQRQKGSFLRRLIPF